VEEEDDFKNFNPKTFWAEANNEYIPGPKITNKDYHLLELLIRFLKNEKSILQIIEKLNVKRLEVLRLLHLLRSLHGISTDRIEAKGTMFYKAHDSRINDKIEIKKKNHGMRGWC